MTAIKQAAIYARVSSEQQAEANTIASQLAAVRERVSHDGLALSSELEFIDEGFSGVRLPGYRQGSGRNRERAFAL